MAPAVDPTATNATEVPTVATAVAMLEGAAQLSRPQENSAAPQRSGPATASAIHAGACSAAKGLSAATAVAYLCPHHACSSAYSSDRLHCAVPPPQSRHAAVRRPMAA